MIPPIAFSEYLIRVFNEVGEHISNLKLQKLLYYTDVWYRVYFKSILFDEKPQAWVHGPVYPSVYHRFKDRGANNLIVERCLDDIKKDLQGIFSDPEKYQFSQEILQHYGYKSAFTLELMTHNEFPWQKAREGFGAIEACTREIDMELARNYYENLLKNA